MDELIKELTLLARAAREYLDKAANPLLPITGGENKPPSMLMVPPVEVPPKKARKTKVEIDLPPAAAVVPNGFADMTDEMSAKEVYTYVKLLLKRFGDVKPGATKPEGYFLAQKMLVEDFNAGAVKDLNHPQRLQFMVKVKDLVDKADKAVAESVAAVGV